MVLDALVLSSQNIQQDNDQNNFEWQFVIFLQKIHHHSPHRFLEVHKVSTQEIFLCWIQERTSDIGFGKNKNDFFLTVFSRSHHNDKSLELLHLDLHFGCYRGTSLLWLYLGQELAHQETLGYWHPFCWRNIHILKSFPDFHCCTEKYMFLHIYDPILLLEDLRYPLCRYNI